MKFFFILFLLLFSYILLCDFEQINKKSEHFESVYGKFRNVVVAIPEIVLIIWVSVFVLEELRELYINESKVLRGKIKSYMLQNWNWLGVIAIIMFYVGITLRFISNDQCFLAARVILCVDILFWYVIGLKAYRFIKSVGPIVIVIEKMTAQLFYFVLIVLAFIFAFGVATQSLMYPNQALDKYLLKNVFFPGFFVFGKEYYTRSEIMNGKTRFVRSN